MAEATARRGRPAREEHAQAQRDRILAAAQRCFVEQGFHAASMANIAETAEMSAGLIYRYFASKNAIILAIIERQLEEKQERVSSMRTTAELVQRMREIFLAWQRGKDADMNAALFLEMSAEASRDESIAAALACSDRKSDELFAGWLRNHAARQGIELDEEELRVRLLLMKCYFEGLAVRAVRDPDLDVGIVTAALERLLQQVFNKD